MHIYCIYDNKYKMYDQENTNVPLVDNLCLFYVVQQACYVFSPAHVLSQHILLVNLITFSEHLQIQNISQIILQYNHFYYISACNCKT
jgi:hypothetical protein